MSAAAEFEAMVDRDIAESRARAATSILHHVPTDLSASITLPEPVIEGLVPRGEVTLLGGHGGSGKSVLALVLAAHVACGKPSLSTLKRSSPIAAPLAQRRTPPTSICTAASRTRSAASSNRSAWHAVRAT